VERRAFPLIFMLAFALAACQHRAGEGEASHAAAACDNSALLRAHSTHATNVEVTICGPVTRVLPERRTRSGRHEYFYVEVAPRDDVEIIANVDVMGDVPVHTGEQARVRGRYFHDPNGREGIDWTHHATPGSRWPSGYITLDGATYR